MLHLSFGFLSSFSLLCPTFSYPLPPDPVLSGLYLHFPGFSFRSSNLLSIFPALFYQFLPLPNLFIPFYVSFTVFSWLFLSLLSCPFLSFPSNFLSQPFPVHHCPFWFYPIPSAYTFHFIFFPVRFFLLLYLPVLSRPFLPSAVPPCTFPSVSSFC